VHGLDRGLGLRGVAEQAAGGGDGVGQGGVGDGAAVPDGGEDLFLRDGAVAVADEEEDELEDLARDVDRLASAGELGPERVEVEVEELVGHAIGVEITRGAIVSMAAVWKSR
jgi:hypothetical protein